MTSDDIVVQKFVDLAVGIPKYTYPMLKNAPRPNGDYAAVQLVSVHSPGTDKVEIIETDESIIHRTTGLRVLKYNILFSRDDVDVEHIKNCLYRPAVQSYMRKNKMGILHVGNLSNDSISLETNWELRTGLTLTYSTVRVSDVVIDSMIGADIEGVFNEGDDVLNLTVNIREDN